MVVCASNSGIAREERAMKRRIAFFIFGWGWFPLYVFTIALFVGYVYPLVKACITSPAVTLTQPRSREHRLGLRQLSWRHRGRHSLDWRRLSWRSLDWHFPGQRSLS